MGGRARNRTSTPARSTDLPGADDIWLLSTTAGCHHTRQFGNQFRTGADLVWSGSSAGWCARCDECLNRVDSEDRYRQRLGVHALDTHHAGVAATGLPTTTITEVSHLRNSRVAMGSPISWARGPLMMFCIANAGRVTVLAEDPPHDPRTGGEYIGRFPWAAAWQSLLDHPWHSGPG